MFSWSFLAPSRIHRLLLEEEKQALSQHFQKHFILSARPYLFTQRKIHSHACFSRMHINSVNLTNRLFLCNKFSWSMVSSLAHLLNEMELLGQ